MAAVKASPELFAATFDVAALSTVNCLRLTEADCAGGRPIINRTAANTAAMTIGFIGLLLMLFSLYCVLVVVVCIAASRHSDREGRCRIVPDDAFSPITGFHTFKNSLCAGAAQAAGRIFRRRLNFSDRALLINFRLFIPAVVTVNDFPCVEYTAKYMVGSGALFVTTNSDHDSPPAVVINKNLFQLVAPL